jgi:diguanylate cyclase (GGDEF)-like protein
MESLQLLSEVVIRTLREISTKKLALTPVSLCEALSTQKEILPFLSGAGSNGSPYATEPDFPLSRKLSPDVALTKTEPSPDANISSLPRLRNVFVDILDCLGPITKEEYVKGASELRECINESRSMDALAEHGENLVDVVRRLATHAIEQIDYANDFLAELGKDLSNMEKQLYSYQDFNRETHLLNDEFRDKLVSHSTELKQAFSVNTNFEHTRNDVTSKLMTLGLAIESKRHEDEIRFQKADKEIAELQTNVRNYNDEIVQVTERAKTLEKEVFLDALTAIQNRRAYEMKIRECLRRYHSDGQPFSLILVDVDRFKNINDKYGHSAGDKCLKQLAKLIRNTLRKTDFFARYGGEELVAVLQGCSAEDAEKVAEKVRVRIEKACFYYHDEEVPVTISLGVTEVRPTDEKSEAVFVRVDNAMYQAKSLGRNRVCVI